jgi:parvulin-like peptidyl-prolyl isomerase
VVAIIVVGAGLAVWKKKAGGHSSESFNSISRADIELLLADMAKKNPMAIKRLAQNPEMKGKQIEGLKQLLAFASQAQREGLTEDPTNREELKSMRSELIAVSYDQELNKDKGPMPQFGFITDDQIKQFWDEGSQPIQQTFWDKIGLGSNAEADGRSREEQFQSFFDSKLNFIKKQNPQFADDQITDEDKQQARDYFAKVQIYNKEYADKVKSGELSDEFKQRTELQIKLQQAQFLAKIYSDKIADQAKVTDDEVAQYIASHPEMDPSAKKAKAQEILDRAKAGENFEELANQYTEDPGNKNEKGESQGGLYKDIRKGQMVPPFEQAALSLEPGHVYNDLVESDYGYHIIKLEKKNESKDANGTPNETYDARHILIATTFKDPENPAAQPKPVKEYVRQKLLTDKEKKIVDDIVAANNVSVPDDYTIPEVSDQQIQEMMKNQGGPMGMPQGGQPPKSVTVDPPKKAEPKKTK